MWGRRPADDCLVVFSIIAQPVQLNLCSSGYQAAAEAAEAAAAAAAVAPKHISRLLRNNLLEARCDATASIRLCVLQTSTPVVHACTHQSHVDKQYANCACCMALPDNHNCWPSPPPSPTPISRPHPRPSQHKCYTIATTAASEPTVWLLACWCCAGDQRRCVHCSCH